eukprot:SAG25_NODE_9803_length_357_cov_1.003876_1_plen_118_part_11
MTTMASVMSAGGGAGTLAWKAPETFSNSYSPASDIFGLAVVDFEIVTRQVPWAGLPQPAVISRVSERFDPTAKHVLRQVKRGMSVEELRQEWLEDNPLSERRPDLSASEGGCPALLLE